MIADFAVFGGVVMLWIGYFYLFWRIDASLVSMLETKRRHAMKITQTMAEIERIERELRAVAQHGGGR